MTDLELKSYVDTRICEVIRMLGLHQDDSLRREKALEKSVEQYRDLTQRALEKAEVSIQTRLDSMNELRKQISEERNLFVSRDMLDEKTDHLHERMETLDRVNSNMEGRLWMFGVALSGVVIALELFFKWLWK